MLYQQPLFRAISEGFSGDNIPASFSFSFSLSIKPHPSIGNDDSRNFSPHYKTVADC